MPARRFRRLKVLYIDCSTTPKNIQTVPKVTKSSALKRHNDGTKPQEPEPRITLNPKPRIAHNSCKEPSVATAARLGPEGSWLRMSNLGFSVFQFKNFAVLRYEGHCRVEFVYRMWGVRCMQKRTHCRLQSHTSCVLR